MITDHKIGDEVLDKYRVKCKILAINKYPNFKYLIEDSIGKIYTNNILKINRKN